MNLKNKTIGIWGLGAVGISALRFLHTHCKQITVLTQNALTPQQEQLLKKYNVMFMQQRDTKTVQAFFKAHDYIVPSPGIDLRPYAQYNHKWLPEVDIFKDYTTTKIIGITGTVGKTTVTTQLGQLFADHNYAVATGGNIGTPMLDLLQQKNTTVNILELSSFQLEHSHAFAPDIGMLTNLYPNHLDRHSTLTEYLAAKMKLFAYQTETQHALLPFSLIPLLDEHSYLQTLRAQLNFFTHSTPTEQQLHQLPAHSTLFYVEETLVKKINTHGTHTIVDLKKELAGAQRENTLLCCAALHLFDSKIIQHAHTTAQQLEHRMELVATINNVTFINDSKSTIAQATLAATQQVKSPTVLLLGGLSKGVNRAPFLAQLPEQVTHIICFGKEAHDLAQCCNTQQSAVYCNDTLEDAFARAQHIAQPGMTLLFSPGGSSFDLFKNYKERGKRFKELVNMVC